MRAGPETEVVEAVGGCYICHGREPKWTAANAVATAARHHKASGHPTWSRQTLIVRFGRDDRRDDQAPTLPGLGVTPST